MPHHVKGKFEDFGKTKHLPMLAKLLKHTVGEFGKKGAPFSESNYKAPQTTSSGRA